ncbi:transposase [Streptomyces antimycoticus]|uniref:Transposase n=1 Tax=Streptomyces antimycoticus TaxID=68175 RepID=A0A499ULL9_9ACTN|nr:transposase [Streptomyces antimycoticus]
MTASCPSAVTGRTTMCRTCEKSWTPSALTREEFAATFTPAPERRLGGLPERCRLTREGLRCRRETYCWGLCQAHATACTMWKRADPARTVEQWLATTKAQPREPLPQCPVLGCLREQADPVGLCGLHRTRWKTEHSGKKPFGDIGAWAAKQAPYVAMNAFSLAPLGDVLRLEFLYGLQQRDDRGGKIDPQAVRWAVKHLQDLPSLALADAVHKDPVRMGANSNGVAIIREVAWAVDVAFEGFRGIDPADKRTWDLVAVGVPSSASRNGRRRQAGKIDFNDFAQPWLRELTWEWARAMRPSSSDLGRNMRACKIASQALSQRRGGGMDPAALQFADMTAVAEAFRRLLKQDGTDISNKHRRDLLASFNDVLDFGRRAGLLDRMSGSFTRHSCHRIIADEANEDEIGKAIPESVIRQLDTHVDQLGAGFVYGLMRSQDVEAMFQAAYGILRDTGRRPLEVSSLRVDCLEAEGDGYSLVWNNRKGRRNRRRLPIPTDTAQYILEWRERRMRLSVPPRSKDYLFPAITNDSADPHLSSGNLGRAIRAWVDSIPVLHSEILSGNGTPLPFSRPLIYPYAFRHSYAQRHADAGIDLDVLRQLMDHKSVQTTMGYYKVSLKRKRAAVNTMRLHVIDRHGDPAPMPSSTAYEARSVAVPFGNCKEPSNIKAGGKACAIRFQCAGCGFYRPDPSFMPAVEDHIRSLKADREAARAMDAADFVVRNLDEQVDAFKDVVDRMRKRMDSLSPEERAEIEEASKALRKSRAAEAGRVLLPLTVIKREEADA